MSAISNKTNLNSLSESQQTLWQDRRAYTQIARWMPDQTANSHVGRLATGRSSPTWHACHQTGAALHMHTIDSHRNIEAILILIKIQCFPNVFSAPQWWQCMCTASLQRISNAQQIVLTTIRAIGFLLNSCVRFAALYITPFLCCCCLFFECASMVQHITHWHEHTQHLCLSSTTAFRSVQFFIFLFLVTPSWCLFGLCLLLLNPKRLPMNACR